MLKAHFIMWFDMNGPIDYIRVALLEDLYHWGMNLEVSKAQVRVILSQSVDQDVALS